MAAENEFWIEPPDVTRLFPTFVWKCRLRPDVHRPINVAILNLLQETRRGLPPLARGEANAPVARSFEPSAFIRIGRDGKIVLIMPYVEMGQGTYTSIPMLIAEELDVGLSQVQLEHAPPNEKLYANPLLGVQATGNSNAMRGAWKPLREAGAVARAVLVAAAAKRWGVEAKSCHTQDGEVSHPPSGRRLKYGELAADRRRSRRPTRACPRP
jgi:isoquinoline 1-oxidoreductase beta subunit